MTTEDTLTAPPDMERGATGQGALRSPRCSLRWVERGVVTSRHHTGTGCPHVDSGTPPEGVLCEEGLFSLRVIPHPPRFAARRDGRGGFLHSSLAFAGSAKPTQPRGVTRQEPRPAQGRGQVGPQDRDGQGQGRSACPPSGPAGGCQQSQGPGSDFTVSGGTLGALPGLGLDTPAAPLLPPRPPALRNLSQGCPRPAKPGAPR